MQIPFLHQQLILETERLRDMHRSMMMHNSAIPASEMESFLQQIRKLYEISLQLGNENSLQLMNEIFLAKQELAHSSPQNTIAVARQQIVSPSPEQSSKETSDLHADKQQQYEKEVKNVAAELKQRAASPLQEISNGSTVAKKFTEHSTVADKIAADNQKRFSENIKLPVSDINAAIGINEKFQFINQLFHGDSKKYSQFITELNNCPSADVAKKTIREVAEANHWETIPVARHFMDVVERRFA